MAATAYAHSRAASEGRDTGSARRRVLRISTMLRNVPLAPNPKSAMLITINERWFHWLMENTRVSKTSKARVARDTKKMAARIIVVKNVCVIDSAASRYFSKAWPVIGTNSTPVICLVI